MVCLVPKDWWGWCEGFPDGWEQWFGGFPRIDWDGLGSSQVVGDNGLVGFQGLVGMVWRVLVGSSGLAKAS